MGYAPTLTRSNNYGGWNEQLMPSTRLRTLNRLTLAVDLDIVAIFDKNGQDITAKYSDKAWSIKSDEYSQIERVSRQMNELIQRMNKMEKDFKAIKGDQKESSSKSNYANER